MRTSAQAQAALAHDGLVLLRDARHDGLVDGRRLRCLVHLLVARARSPVPAGTMQRISAKLKNLSKSKRRCCRRGPVYLNLFALGRPFLVTPSTGEW